MHKGIQKTWTKWELTETRQCGGLMDLIKFTSTCYNAMYVSVDLCMC